MSPNTPWTIHGLKYKLFEDKKTNFNAPKLHYNLDQLVHRTNISNHGCYGNIIYRERFEWCNNCNKCDLVYNKLTIWPGYMKSGRSLLGLICMHIHEAG